MFLKGGDFMDKTCRKCKQLSHKEGAQYCSNCGTSLVPNLCSDENCKEAAIEPLDSYCYICGKETTYYKLGINSPSEKGMPF